jgi:hypothetical protein
MLPHSAMQSVMMTKGFITYCVAVQKLLKRWTESKITIDNIQFSCLYQHCHPQLNPCDTILNQHQLLACIVEKQPISLGSIYLPYLADISLTLLFPFYSSPFNTVGNVIRIKDTAEYSGFEFERYAPPWSLCSDPFQKEDFPLSNLYTVTYKSQF